MTRTKSLPPLLFCALLAACGGVTTVDSIGAPPPSGSGTGSDTPPPGSSGSADPGPPRDKPISPQATGPYTGTVGTTDVSILYPLPSIGENATFIRPTEVGNFGALLPRTFVDGVTTTLEKVTSTYPSGYETLALVSLRLDPCSARRAPAESCTSEVRGVFQAIYTKPAGDEGDPSAGPAATDGALHVMWDVSRGELVTMLKEILTLKKANGDLALQELAPHPILKQQGLSGAFASGLRNIVLEHLGGDRVARITVFDHNFNPDSDGWTFEVFDRAAGASVLTPAKIHGSQNQQQTIAGSAANAELVQSSASTFSGPSTQDAVEPIVDPQRAPTGTAPMRAAYDAALRVQNPTRHNAETTDCANCHLAEGAARLGTALYGFGVSAANTFTHSRSLARTDERTSVSNLHAFGYLHRRVSIMQRTANESVVVAATMEPLVK